MTTQKWFVGVWPEADLAAVYPYSNMCGHCKFGSVIGVE